jgi:asparagine synthase (glutamine-hydrolysing)
MSGIAGVVRFDGQPVTQGSLEAMLVPMRRRGPDRQNVHAAGNAGFGQALLATTPEAQAERQPWVHPTSRCLVVSDSRLDNRPELVAELGLAGPADAIGDGELLHAAWQRWGEGCADRLRGDFAFAVWDPRAQALFCARDIMGVRPFCFHHVPGKLFAFASDTDALLALPDVPRRINEGRIADALMGDLEGIDRTSTFYLDAERLPPARTLQVDASGARQAEYWNPLMHRPADLPDTEAGWIEAVRRTLEDAVRRRLRGSGRVGSMVSGGLDSSSVAALAQGMLPAGERLPTFSAINSEGPCIETECVRAMVRALDFDAHLIDLKAIETVAQAVHDQLDQMVEPFDGTMSLLSAVYAVCGQAGVRSVMDGMPADNLYTVGDHYRGLARARRWRLLWNEALAAQRSERVAVPRLRALQSFLGAVVPAALRRPWDAWRDWQLYRHMFGKSLITREFESKVGLRDRFRQYRADMVQTRLGDRSGTPQTVMTAAYITGGIERYNRIASYHGVEPRPVFLDRQVIELHAWLPLELRLRQGWHKWVLRQAMDRTLPRAVAWRRVRDHLGGRFNHDLVEPWAFRQATRPGPPLRVRTVASTDNSTNAGLVAHWIARRTWYGNRSSR